MKGIIVYQQLIWSFVVMNKHSELKVGPAAVCIGATVC